MKKKNFSTSYLIYIKNFLTKNLLRFIQLIKSHQATFFLIKKFELETKKWRNSNVCELDFVKDNFPS
jgi:hypothetical protein